ncbi:MAG: hypothetical protein AB7Q37_03000 [Pyrinomonadaceae bacterium]
MIISRSVWAVSLATFGLSVLLNSVLVLRTELPVVEVDQTGQIVIEHTDYKLDSDPKTVTFKVTNLTDDTIYYPGWERDHNALVWIRQNGKIEDALQLACWRGVETQSLEPTQEAYFSVPVPQNGKPYRVGFDFRVDTRGGWKTVWVEGRKLVL